MLSKDFRDIAKNSQYKICIPIDTGSSSAAESCVFLEKTTKPVEEEWLWASHAAPHSVAVRKLRLCFSYFQ